MISLNRVWSQGVKMMFFGVVWTYIMTLDYSRIVFTTLMLKVYTLAYTFVDLEAQQNGVNKHTFFKVIAGSQIQSSAQLKCTELHPGSSLAAIYSQKENNYVKSLMSEINADKAWIGANDIGTEGTFLWAYDYDGKEDGELLFDDWQSIDDRDGGQDCAEIRNDGWYDVSCGIELEYSVCQIRIDPVDTVCFSLDKEHPNILASSKCYNEYYPLCQKRRCLEIEKDETSLPAAAVKDCTCENGIAADEIDCRIRSDFKNSNSSCIACNIGYILDVDTDTCYKSDNYWSIHYMAAAAGNNLESITHCAPNIHINFERNDPLQFENNQVQINSQKWAKTAYKIGYNATTLATEQGKITSVRIEAACEDDFSGRIRIDTPEAVYDLQTVNDQDEYTFDFFGISTAENKTCNANSTSCIVEKEDLLPVETIFCNCTNGFPHTNESEECPSAGDESCKSCFEAYYLENGICKEYCDLDPFSDQCLVSKGWEKLQLKNSTDSTDTLFYKLFIEEQKSSMEARKYCQEVGGTLASIFNIEEYVFIRSIVGSDDDFWVEHSDQAINNICHSTFFDDPAATTMTAQFDFQQFMNLAECQNSKNFICQYRKPYKTCDYDKGLKWHHDKETCQCMGGFEPITSSATDDLECARICPGGGHIASGFSCSCQKTLKRIKNSDASCYDQGTESDLTGMKLALVESDFENNKSVITDKSIINLRCPSYVDYIEIYPELNDENLVFLRYVKVFVKALDQQLHECHPVNTDLSYHSLSRLTNLHYLERFPNATLNGAPIRFDCTNYDAQSSYGTNTYAKVQDIIVTNINDDTGMIHANLTFNQLFVYEKLFCTAENVTEPITIDWVEYEPSEISVADTIKYYYPDPEIPHSYVESKMICESFGGELATMINQHEETFIASDYFRETVLNGNLTKPNQPSAWLNAEKIDWKPNRCES